MAAGMADRISAFLITPLEQRTPHTVLSLARFFGLSTLVGVVSIWIRLRRPDLHYAWRLAFLLASSVLTLHWSYENYTYFPWQSTSRVIQSFTITFDCLVSLGAVGSIIMAVDMLFLSSPDDYTIVGAQAYRKWLKDQNPTLTEEQLAQMERQKAGGYTLERPRCYPGTTTTLVEDLLIARRGAGYAFGPPKPPFAQIRYEAGYEALIASEKLAQQTDQKAAKAIKRDAIVRALRTMLGHFAVFAVSLFILHHTTIVIDRRAPFGKMRYYPTIYELAENGSLGRSLGAAVATGLYGTVLLCHMQNLHIIGYLMALLITRPAHKIPVLISRWEPYAFYKPYTATSMEAVWRTHWHSMLRRIFVVCTVRPTMRLCSWLRLPKSVARSVALLLSFLLSGLLHEVCLETIFGGLYHKQAHHSQQRVRASGQTMRNVGYGFGANRYANTLAFVSFGVVIIVENVVQQIEKQVAGALGLSKKRLLDGNARKIVGWIWTMSMMVLCSIRWVNTWGMHGFFSCL